MPFSLAMQETAFQNKSKFIAPFLIIDQPSRPYYGGEDDKKSDIDYRENGVKSLNLIN